MTSLILIPAMLPISYAIFGYPRPQQWVLPIDFQWAFYQKNETLFDFNVLSLIVLVPYLVEQHFWGFISIG